MADGGEPPLSSTATLSLRVCVCQRNTRGRNSNNVCQAQAFLSSAGLSTGAFVAILLCIVILLGKYAFNVLTLISYGYIHSGSTTDLNNLNVKTAFFYSTPIVVIE